MCPEAKVFVMIYGCMDKIFTGKNMNKLFRSRNLFKLLNLLILMASFFLHGCGQIYTGGLGQQAPSSIPVQANRIALLLPLSGSLAAQGQAIRNGFFAAYYQDKQQQSKAPEIQVIDTSQGDIIALYQQAIRQGARIVVGPLLKEDVERLAQWNHLTVPTLALNSIGVGPIRNLYQFGLSPIDEAQQAALRAWTDGYRQALVIAPNTDWGHANANIFAQQFQQYGGRVAGQAFYYNQTDLDSSIRQLLWVNTAIVNNKRIPSSQKRRQDADMVFMIAPPEFARQIKPLLNYYYAGNLPIYATSHVYQGVLNPSLDNDLNSIEFCDMPWTINQGHLVPGSLNRLHDKIVSVWPDEFAAQPRLYALGVDAYDILGQLNNMVASSRYIVDAATGMLYLNSQQRIVRQLYWARFEQGVPRPL